MGGCVDYSRKEVKIMRFSTAMGGGGGIGG